MISGTYIRLSQWAAQHGMHRMTAWRHYNAGTLPPELQPKKIGNIICNSSDLGERPGLDIELMDCRGPLGQRGVLGVERHQVVDVPQ